MKLLSFLIKKDFLHTIRDRKAMINMIIIPILIVPVLSSIAMSFSKSVSEENAAKSLKVAVINGDQQWNQLNYPDSKIEFVNYTEHEDSLKKEIDVDSLAAGIIFPSNFDQTQEQKKSAEIRVLFKASEIENKKRFEKMIDQYNLALQDQRLTELQLTRENIEPISIKWEGIESTKEVVARLAGGFLPYIFIIFGFMGGMYPAMDLITGDKEKGTLETILVAPISRLQILAGKLTVIATAGLTAILLSISGIFFALKFNPDLAGPIGEVLMSILSPYFIGHLLLMIIPLVIFFAGIQTIVCAQAKSYKEAQSIIGPLNMLVIMPGVLALIPGVELNAVNAIIPIFNIALATKEILAGSIYLPHFILVCFSFMIYAFVSLWFASRFFGKESHILKG